MGEINIGGVPIREESNLNGLISGGAIWDSGLLYNVSAVQFVLEGVVYNTAANVVTLDTADGVNPRIDVIVANTNGTNSVVTGIPAATPVKPEINLFTQIEVTFATISAGASVPDDVASLDIYREDAGNPGEWDATETTGGARIDLADATAAQNGVVGIRGTDMVVGDSISFTPVAPINTANFSVLSISMKGVQGSPWHPSARMTMQFFLGAVPASSKIVIRDDNILWNFNNSSDWIFNVYDRNDWNFSSATVDSLKILCEVGTLSFVMDDIYYVTGQPTPTEPGSFTITDGTNPFNVSNGDTLRFQSGDASVVISTATEDVIDFTVGAAALLNIYTGDGALTGNRVVTAAANRLDITGTEEVVNINSTSTNNVPSLRVTATDGTAINASTTGNRVTFTASSTGSTTAFLAKDGSTVGDSQSVLVIQRTTSGGTATSGIGATIGFQIEEDSGTIVGSGHIRHILTDVSSGAETGQFEFHIINGGSFGRRMSVAGDGTIILDGYTGTAKDDTPLKTLGVMAGGKVITYDVVAGNLYTIDGTLTGDRTVITGINELTFTGTGTNTDVIIITNDVSTSAGAALRVTSIDNGAAILAVGSAGVAVIQSTGSGLGPAFSAIHEDGVGFQSSHTPTVDTNTAKTFFRSQRSTNGTAAAGIGSRFEYWIENGAGGNATRGRIDVILTDVTDALETAEYQIALMNAGNLEGKFIVGGNGDITFEDYVGTDKDDTPLKTLGVKAGGVIVTSDVVTGNIYTEDGTLTGDREVTIDSTDTLTFTVNATGAHGIIINKTAGSSNSGLRVTGDLGNILSTSSDTGSSPVQFQNSGLGNCLWLNSDGGSCFLFDLERASTSGVDTIGTFKRSTTGTAANGIGMDIKYQIESSGGGTNVIALNVISLSNATDSAEVAKWDINLINGGSIESKFTIDGNGDITFHDYTQGYAEFDSGGAITSSPIVESIQIESFDGGAVVTTGDGVKSLTIPAYMNGYELTNIVCSVEDKGVTGTTDVVIRRWRAGTPADMTSTPVTIGDEWFAQDGIIDAANDDVATGDRIYVDVDDIHSGTAPNGLSVVLEFTKP